MKRRTFISGVGGTLAWPLVGRAERPVPTIGYLGSRSRDTDAHLVRAFLDGLAETGYVDGRNAMIEFLWAEGRYERLPGLAADFVRRSVAVMVATGGTPAALAARSATTKIPVVFIMGGDPVTTGIVESIARPGGNVTGLAIVSVALDSKRFDMLRELMPEADKLAMLVNSSNPNVEKVLAEVRKSALLAGRHLIVAKAANEGEFDAAFALIRESRAAGLLVAADPFLASRYEQLVEMVGRLGIPAIYQFREFVAAGGLMSFGASRGAPFREAGRYVGRILSGAKPSDLPVQQAAKFELAINLKTAKALGLTVPLTLLVRADEVIE